MRANDAIVGAVLIAFAVAMIGLTASFPDFPGQKYGPALFPRILGAGLGVCGVLMIRNGLAAQRSGGAWLALAPWIRDPDRVIAFLLVIGVVTGYILFADSVGFIPAAILFLLVLLGWLGVRTVPAIATAIVAAVAMQWLFGSILRVPLPRGWLTTLM